jgi:hypothetical protein
MPETKPRQDWLPLAVISSGAPTAQPPTSVAARDSVAASDASTWLNGKKINALWTVNENRNSWAGIAGVGWVRLANNSDSAIVALSILCAHAKQTQATVNYRQEADDMIHEMYVW